MPDYSNGKIYAIRAPGTDEVYVGSTCSSLSQRMASHRRDFKRYCEGKMRYVRSFDIIDKGNAYIELIETFSCKNKEELAKKEGDVIRSMTNVVNKRIEGQTSKEYASKYYKANQEKCRDALRNWQDTNREHVNQKAREYRAKKKAQQASQAECPPSSTHPSPTE